MAFNEQALERTKKVHDAKKNLDELEAFFEELPWQGQYFSLFCKKCQKFITVRQQEFSKEEAEEWMILMAWCYYASAIAFESTEHTEEDEKIFHTLVNKIRNWEI